MTIPESVPAKLQHPYATFIPTRRPQFKTHSRVEHVKNAINNFQGPLNNGRYTCDMIAYKLDGGQYVPWIRVMEHTQRDDYPDLAKKPAPVSDQVREIRRLEAAAKSYADLSKQKYREAALLRAMLSEQK